MFLRCSANRAASPLLTYPDRQWMSVWAVSPPCMDGAHTSLGAQDVFGVGHEFEMCRITARSITAGDMVENRDVTVSASRQWVNQPSKHQPVREDVVIFELERAVTALIASCCPNPTASRPVDGNLGKDPSESRTVQSENRCEILACSHDSASRAGAGSGPEARLPRVFGPIILSLAVPS